MKNKLYYTAFCCLFLCTQKILSQTIAVKKTDTIVTANTNYNKAGSVKRLFLGEHYRKEWAAPVQLKVLNLDSTAGGLTAIKAGGGHQTKSLRLKGGDGKEYVLRSVNKDPTKALPPEFVGTFAADIVQDQISSSNPYVPPVVAALCQAAGIFHATPEIVFVPASPRLDTFINDFANTVCLFEERPSGNEEDNAAFGNSKSIINTEKLFEKLLTDNTNRVDQRSFLKARLFDIWIGDWDRHEDQWVWAAFTENDKTIYKPIPRDRDQAFAKLDGILPSMAQKPWAIRTTKNFGHKIHDVQGLAMSGNFLDHNFINELSLNDWLSVATELQQNLTDEKIENAFKLLPQNIYDISAKEIIVKLKRRRDDLATYTKDYYYFLSREVTVAGTQQKEFFEVTRMDNDSTKVAVYKIDNNNRQAGAIFQRTFLQSETNEIRLYGFGGDDKFNVSGNADKNILIRVIGGKGNDSTTAAPGANDGARKTKIYDNDINTFVAGSETKKYISNDSLKNSFNKSSFKYDYFSPKLAPGYNSDDGVYLGGGIIIKKQRFGKAPYGYIQSVWANYAFKTSAYNFWYEGIFKEAIGKWDLQLNARLNAPNYVLNYYGEGNETVINSNVKNYYRIRANQIIISPSLVKQIGKYQTFGAGLDFESIKIERNENRFITDIHSELDSSVFERKYFGSAYINYQFNTTDNVLYPRKGIEINSAIAFIQNLEDTKRNFARLSSDISFFGSLQSLTAAVRIGGATNIGNNYEFYQANTLGGTTNARGFRRTRFSGKTSLYQNVELRYKLQNLKGRILRGNWGLLAFFDNGRVWIPDETSNIWHYGYGGGIWFLPYNKIAFTVSYGISKEDNLLNIKAGFFF